MFGWVRACVRAYLCRYIYFLWKPASACITKIIWFTLNKILPHLTYINKCLSDELLTMWSQGNGATNDLVEHDAAKEVCVQLSANNQQGSPIPPCHSSIIQPASTGLPQRKRLEDERMKTWRRRGLGCHVNTRWNKRCYREAGGK